jgi:hypothetical protein
MAIVSRRLPSDRGLLLPHAQQGPIVAAMIPARSSDQVSKMTRASVERAGIISPQLSGAGDPYNATHDGFESRHEEHR